MNKAKIMLSAVAAIAAIGGAFALKSSKAVQVRLLYDVNGDNICSHATTGYAYTFVDAGVRGLYLTGNATITAQPTTINKDCTPKYYRIGF